MTGQLYHPVYLHENLTYVYSLGFTTIGTTAHRLRSSSNMLLALFDCGLPRVRNGILLPPRDNGRKRFRLGSIEDSVLTWIFMFLRTT